MKYLLIIICLWLYITIFIPINTLIKILLFTIVFLWDGRISKVYWKGVVYTTKEWTEEEGEYMYIRVTRGLSYPKFFKFWKHTGERLPKYTI